MGDIRARNAANLLFISRDLLRKDVSNRVISYQADIKTLVSKMSDLIINVSDPRGFVYSLISLARDTHDPKDFSPDYKKSGLGVCIDLIGHVIRTKQSLDVICRPWAPLIPGLPSWVQPRAWPKYTFDSYANEVQASAGTFVGLNGCSFYSASNQSFACAEISKSSESGYILRARGFIADTVVQRQDCASQGRIPRNWDLLLLGRRDSTLRSWIMSFFAPHMDLSLMSHILLVGKPLSGHRPPESYTKICEASMFLIREISWGYGYSIYELRERLLGRDFPDNSRRTAASINAHIKYLSAQPEPLDFLQRVAECVWNRRLIKTSEDRFGLVPKSTEKNDLIAILLGCSVPLVF